MTFVRIIRQAFRGGDAPIVMGNGSPEGVVARPVGWLYVQLDQHQDRSPLWIKRRGGSGSTGWRPDNGWGVGSSSFAIGNDVAEEDVPGQTFSIGGGDPDLGQFSFRLGAYEQATLPGVFWRLYVPSAGGVDGAGRDWRYDAARGTGAGVPGRHIFRASVPAASGSGLQALLEALVVGGDKVVVNVPLEILGGVTGLVSAPTERTAAVLQLIKNAGAATVTGVGLASPAVNGGATLDGTWGRMVLCTTGAVIGNTAGLAPAPLGRFDFNGDHIGIVRTSTSIAAIRLWFGLATAGLSAVSTPGAGQDVAAFRFATDVDVGATWRAVTHDGSGNPPTVTDTGVPIAVTTNYRGRVVRLASGNVDFYLNDVLVATHTTRLPAGASISNWVTSVTTLAAAAKAIGFSRAAFIYVDA